MEIFVRFLGGWMESQDPVGHVRLQRGLWPLEPHNDSRSMKKHSIKTAKCINATRQTLRRFVPYLLLLQPQLTFSGLVSHSSSSRQSSPASSRIESSPSSSSSFWRFSSLSSLSESTDGHLRFEDGGMVVIRGMTYAAWGPEAGCGRVTKR